MNTLVRVLGGLALVLLLLVVVAFFLPASSHVERSVLIDAKPMDAFTLVNYLPNWQKWSPWYELEPEARLTYSEPASGNGAWYSWVGDKTGSGKLTLAKVESPRRIETDLYFEGQGDAEADFVFEPVGEDQVRVTWMFDTEHGNNPAARYFGLMMDGFLGPDYERGLANLKREAEAARTSADAQRKEYRSL